MNALTRRRAELIERAETWQGMSSADRKQAATIAAHERDAAALWSLTEAHRTLRGRKGARVSPRTLDNYRRGVLALVEAWSGENLIRPSSDAGHMYARRLETHYAPATVAVHLASCRALYEALRWAEATTAYPFRGVSAAPDPTPPEAKRAAWTASEVALLLRAAVTPSDRVLVLLGAHAGLRASEMVALHWEHVHMGSGDALGHLEVRAGKGGKAAEVSMSHELAEALEAWRSVAPADARVLPFGSRQRAGQRLEALTRRAGLAKQDGKSVHSLRHYAGTRMYEATRDLHAVADHLRHSDINTSRRYAKQSRTLRDAAVLAAFG